MVTVVYCHPLEGSLTAAARDIALEALRGVTTHLVDLSAPDRDTAGLAETDADALSRSSGLVLVYPTWWSGPPGALQRWFDEVWPPSARFGSIERIVACTSHGSSKLVNSLEGESGKRTVSRYLRPRCARRCRVEWVALYGLDRCSPEHRARHLERVGQRIKSLRS